MLKLAAAAVALLFAQGAVAVTLFAVSQTDRNLYELNTASLGTPTLVGNIGPYADLSTLVASSPDRLYTTDRATNRLLTVDRYTGAVLASVVIDRPIGTHPRGYAVSPGGVLYGIIGATQGAPPTLYTVDPMTGVTSLVSVGAGAAGVEAIAFGPDGTLYAAGSPFDPFYSGQLYRMNVATGVLTSIGSLGGLDIDDLAFGADGFLYGADAEAGVNAFLYRIDPLTAAVTNLGYTGVFALNGLAAAAVVPVPGAALLFGSALGLVALARRKIST